MLDLESLKSKLKKDENNNKYYRRRSHNLVSSQPFQFIKNSYELYINKEEKFGNVGRTDLAKHKFSHSENNLLYSRTDLQYKDSNYEMHDFNRLNGNLNEIYQLLNEKDINLIVFFAPNKYSFYYEHIQDKQGLEEPQFFSRFDKLEKNYNYFNALDYLKKYDTMKDIYLYDDTHWSRIGDSLIANKVLEYID